MAKKWDFPVKKGRHQPMYTPGPWRKQGNIIFGATPGSHVCKIFSQHVPGEKSGFHEEKANIFLIAAAPELLEVLMDLQRALIMGGLNTKLEIRIHEVVAKALGPGEK